MNSTTFLKRKRIIFLLAYLNVFTVIFICLFLLKLQTITAQDKRFNEILNNQTQKMNFGQLSTFFQDLAKAKGGAYAFQALTSAKVGPGIDTHLLGHVVGDELYKQKGINGIKDCTQDLRNACSHSIVVGAFSQLGEKALPEISDACEHAPGGKGAYTMCFHGLGHGVLAYYGYDFQKMIKSCEKTGTKAHNNQEFSECVGGAVMEIISGGGHDRETWAKQRPKYLHPATPLSLCSAQNMPERARSMCYTYLTPYLWEASGGNLNNTSRENIQKAFLYCKDIPENAYQDICYGSFGKEFIGLATSRDIRQAGSISVPQAKIIQNLCYLAPNEQAISDCIQTTVGSLFWGGENDPRSSLLFCKQYSNTPFEKVCYQEYISNVKSYTPPSKINDNCSLLPKNYQAACNTHS